MPTRILTELSGNSPDPVPFSKKGNKFITNKFKLKFKFPFEEEKNPPISINITLEAFPHFFRLLNNESTFQFRQVTHNAVRSKDLFVEFDFTDDPPQSMLLIASAIEVDPNASTTNPTANIQVQLIAV